MARTGITSNDKFIDEMTTEEMIELFGMEDGPREDFSHLSDKELDELIESERRKMEEGVYSAA